MDKEQTIKDEQHSEALIDLPSIFLNKRQLFDYECLSSGAFYPLRGFMCSKDYISVCESMRLASNHLWPIPITLDISSELADKLHVAKKVVLRDPTGIPLAILHIQEIWQPDKTLEAKSVYGTSDEHHPGIHFLTHHTQEFYIGGDIEPLRLPEHYDFLNLRLTPDDLKAFFTEKKWERIIAFQTRNPMHRAHVELTQRAMNEYHGNLLLHPVVGITKQGDINYPIRIRCYQHVLSKYPKNKVKLSLLPLAMRMAGPREALWHAIIRKNYGCTHFIVGRDHAGPGKESNGEHFYSPYDAQALCLEHEKEIGMTIIPFKEMHYVKRTESFEPENEISPDEKILTISGTELRRRLENGEKIPSWFSYPKVIQELRHAYPLKSQQGFTLFFTGLSASGKSTLANAITQKLQESGKRNVTLLDGDIVRHYLTEGLGFTKADRDANVRRIGFVASEITKYGGIAICALIAPYQATRQEVRELISSYGGFIEIYVSTPIDVCEQRDPKGLYTKAKAGLIEHFTGVNDPYETPFSAEITLDTSEVSLTDAVDKIYEYLINAGYRF